MAAKASRGKGRGRGGSGAAASTVAPTRRSTRGQQNTAVEFIDDIEGVLRRSRATRGRAASSAQGGRRNTGALRPPASETGGTPAAPSAAEDPPAGSQTNGGNPPAGEAPPAGATAPIPGASGDQETGNGTETENGENEGGPVGSDSGEKRPRAEGGEDDEDREPKRPKTGEKDKEGENGNSANENGEPNEPGATNENDENGPRGDAESGEKKGAEDEEPETERPPRVPTPPTPPPANPCQDFRESLEQFRVAATAAGIEIEEQVESGRNLYHQTVARAIAAVTEPMANNGGHHFSLPDPELSGTTPSQTALRPGHDVVWPYARGRPAPGYVTRGGHLALFVFHAPTSDNPNVTVHNFDTTSSPAEVAGQVRTAYHEVRDRILGREWITPVQQAAAVIPDVPMNRPVFGQNGNWTCGLHALFSAWTYVLGLKLNDDMTRRFGGAFYTAGVEIANLALQGQMDSQTIRNFLACYGWIAPDCQVPADRVVARTQAFTSTADLSRYIARARLENELIGNQAEDPGLPDLDLMLTVIGEGPEAAITGVDLPGMTVAELRQQYIIAAEFLEAQGRAANEVNGAGAAATNGDAGAQSGGSNGGDESYQQTQNTGASNQSTGPTGNGGAEIGTNGAGGNNAGTNPTDTNSTNPAGPSNPPPAGTNRTDPTDSPSPPPATSTTTPDSKAAPESSGMAARFMARFPNLPGLQDQDALRNYYATLRPDPPAGNTGSSDPQAPPPPPLTGANTASSETTTPATTSVLAGLHPGVVQGRPEFESRQAAMQATREASRGAAEGEEEEDDGMEIITEAPQAVETALPSEPAMSPPLATTAEEQETDPAFRECLFEGGEDGGDDDFDSLFDEDVGGE